MGSGSRAWVAVLALAVGCAKHAYVSTGAPRTQQETDADLYACMKENIAHESSASTGRNGFSASSGDEVQYDLVRACMSARGYDYAVVSPVKKSDKAYNRPPEQGPVIGSLAAGLTAGQSGIGPTAAAGVAATLTPNLELGLAAGLANEEFLEASGRCGHRGEFGPQASLVLLGRIPPVPRLGLRLGVGAQQVDPNFCEGWSAHWSPRVVYGAAYDFAYAERYGLQLAFDLGTTVDGAIRPAATTAAALTLAYRVSFGG